jgi:hypothetical protein
MKYEGQTFLTSAQVCWVTLDPDGTVRCPRGTRWTNGLIALRLPEGVELEALAIEPELLAQGLDLANAGQQYGDTVYLRSLTGFVLAPEVLGQYTLKSSQPQADAAPEKPKRAYTRRVPAETPEAA